MKNIMIPTDFSENSWNAIEYALRLYKKDRCNIYLLHVVSTMEYLGDDLSLVPAISTLEVTMIKDAKVQLQTMEKRIARLPFNTRHNFIPMAVYGLFLETLRNEVKEKGIDVIVMGTKGASGLKKVVLGSNAGDVITKVHCPVLIVPEDAEYHSPKEIAFPTDYNIFYGVTILDTVLEMARINNSSVRILHVSKKDEKLNEGQKRNKELLEAYFEGTPHSFHNLTNNKLDSAIQNFVESRDINMITMVAKHLNFFEQILFKPTVEEISYHTKIPFLVLHE